MLRRLPIAVIVLALVGLAVFWVLTMPRGLAAGDLPDHEPDLANGERMFWAGGCEACHAADDAKGEDLFVLDGSGEGLVSPFGTFYAPNISPDTEDGIGGWTLAEFVNSMKYGVGKGGRHLYPAFPYTSYQRMTVEDIIDLKAFLDTLPAVAAPSRPHDVPLPFNIRRGLGLWQLLYVDGRAYEPDPDLDEETNLGGYLVEGPAHCAECHTPRNAIGGMDAGRPYGGSDDPKVPNISNHPDRLGFWTEDDIVVMFQTGQTADFGQVARGDMDKVQRNMARLPESDQRAMARYLKTLPVVEPTGNDK